MLRICCLGLLLVTTVGSEDYRPYCSATDVYGLEENLRRVNEQLREVDEKIAELEKKQEELQLLSEKLIDLSDPTWSFPPSRLHGLEADIGSSAGRGSDCYGQIGIRQFVAGDSEGMIYVFSSSGDSLAELDTDTHSPVVDIVSYQISTSKSAVVAIHSDGRLGVHVIKEKISKTEDTNSRMEIITKNLLSETKSSASPSRLFVARTNNRIKLLLTYEDGKAAWLHSNGTTAKEAVLPSRIFDVKTGKSLSETIASTCNLDKAKVVIGHGQGFSVYTGNRTKHLNCSSDSALDLKWISFDSYSPRRAFGVSKENELITFAIDTDQRLCAIRHKEPLPKASSNARIIPIRGFLLIASTDDVKIMNTTLSTKVRPKHMMDVSFSEISRQIGVKSNPEDPFAVMDADGDLALNLGSGRVGFFHSPQFREPTQWSMGSFYRITIICSSIVFVVYKIYSKKSSIDTDRMREERGFLNMD